MNSTYDKTTEASDAALKALRQSLEPIVPSNAVALTCGSYARRDATIGLDLDFYVLVPDLIEQEPEWFKAAKAAIAEVVRKPPAAGGAFESLIQIDGLLNNFGGDKDTNQTITRRMLYLSKGVSYKRSCV